MKIRIANITKPARGQILLSAVTVPATPGLSSDTIHLTLPATEPVAQEILTFEPGDVMELSISIAPSNPAT